MQNKKDKKTLWKKIWNGIKYVGISILAAYGSWSLITDASEWNLIKYRRYGDLIRANTYYIRSQSYTDYLLKKNFSRFYIFDKSFPGFKSLEEKTNIFYENLKNKKSENKQKENIRSAPEALVTERYKIKEPKKKQEYY